MLILLCFSLGSAVDLKVATTVLFDEKFCMLFCESDNSIGFAVAVCKLQGVPTAPRTSS
jgi:hypothetical protein